jgi:dienelactone hydrolase
LLVDSNSLPRYSRSGAPDTLTGYNFLDQAVDAIVAAKFLATLPFVDSDRIVLVGHAYGGSAALRAVSPNAMSSSPVSNSPERIPAFAGVVAWHPYCPEAPGGFDAPVLVLIGARDSNQPVHACKSLSTRATTELSVQTRTFDTAGHNYDVEWMPEYDSTATEESYKEIRKFLKERVRINHLSTVTRELQSNEKETVLRGDSDDE